MSTEPSAVASLPAMIVVQAARDCAAAVATQSSTRKTMAGPAGVLLSAWIMRLSKSDLRGCWGVAVPCRDCPGAERAEPGSPRIPRDSWYLLWERVRYGSEVPKLELGNKGHL